MLFFFSARVARFRGRFFCGVGREGGALIRRGSRSFDQHVPDLGLARLRGAAQPDAAGSVARRVASARGRSQTKRK